MDALSRSRPEVKVLVTTTDGELDHLVRGNLRKVSWADMVGDRLETEIARLRTLERVQALRDLLDPADDVALLLQPDPDPDGIASALALRQILRRNRATAPIVTFGGVSRPENVAMLELLEIDLEVIRPEDLGALRRRRPAGRAAQRVPRRPSRRWTSSSTTIPSRRGTRRASATSARPTARPRPSSPSTAWPRRSPSRSGWPPRSCTGSRATPCSSTARPRGPTSPPSRTSTRW